MEHLAGRLPVKRDPFVRHEESAGVSGVERLRGYYDEARNRLRQYLGRDDGECGATCCCTGCCWLLTSVVFEGFCCYCLQLLPWLRLLPGLQH